MNGIWQQLTLTRLPLLDWQQSSYLHRLVGLIQSWRQKSWLMQWSDEIGMVLLSVLYGLAPFVSTTLTGLLLIACGAFWILMTLSDESSEVRTALFSPIHLVLLLYWGIATVTTALSPVKKAAFTGWVNLTLYLILFALAARVLRSSRLRSWLITLYLHIALIVSAYGLRQWFLGAAALATWVDPESPLSKTTRVYSYLNNPNLLAGYLVPAIAFSIAALFVWKGWLPKALALVMVSVNLSCLILTFSRGGWIGLLVSLFVTCLLLAYWFSIYLPPFWQTWLIPGVVGGLALVLVIGLLFVQPLRDRALSMVAGRGDSSNNYRINVWQSALKMIRDRPLTGIGPGHDAFNKIYPLYQRAGFSALSAYSIFLQTAVESGLFGLASFLWFLVISLNQGWLHLQELRQQGRSDGIWLLAAIATALGMLGHGLVDTVWYRPQVSSLWWLVIGLIASYYRPSQTESKDSTPEPAEA